MAFKGLIASGTLLAVASCWPGALAQVAPRTSRIAGPVTDSRLVSLRGNTHPLARPEFDRGQAPPDLPLRSMLLVLNRSPRQEAALASLLAAQHDRSSPSFHRWLTPAEFGLRFGPSNREIQTVTAWLTAQGFAVHGAAAGRSAIEFSGTAEQVRTAFHTEIHNYVVNGEAHWANQSDPRIPAALAPVVAGVATLHNFRPKPAYRLPRRAPGPPSAGVAPDYNLGQGAHGISPADFATIYGLRTIYSSGLDGTGVTIGVLGDDLISLQDVADFRSVFGLPAQTPQVIVVGTSPDFWTGDNNQEGILDVEWSGAVAPGATIKYIIGSPTDVSAGLDLAEQYAVDNNAADIITESYLVCEADMTSALQTHSNALRQQAAAQGITWLVASGDSGAYCDAVIGTLGTLTPNGLATSPYVVAVGGTKFSPGTNSLAFWSLTNNITTYSSALSYVPEVAWNDSCSPAQCGAANATIGASGGGVSSFYAKPAWQSGVAGIPNDGFRDIPDVSLVASPQDAGYLTCFNASCETSVIGPASFQPVGGTSASVQAFGGIMALIVQQTKSRQGQANFELYRLAATEQYSRCVAYTPQLVLPDATCIFNDVTIGDNTVPGETGYGTSLGNYQATAGYDLVTGLGSVKANQLVLQWNTSALLPTSTSLSVSPPALVHGSAATVSATVTPGGGAGVPTGDIALLSSAGLAGGLFTLNNGTVSSAASALPGGTYQISARYSGDGNYAPSVSPPVSLTVTPEPVTATVGALFDVYAPSAYYSGGTYGNTSLLLRADVNGLSGQGYPSGAVTFLDNGTPIGGGGQMDSQGHAISVDSSVVFSGGPHVLVAQYAGDASFLPGVSAPAVITIRKMPTVTGIQSLTTSVAGQPFTVSASVEGGSPPYGDHLTGTVTFYANGTALSKPVSLGVGTDTYTGLMTGTTSNQFPSLPLGLNTLTAAYSGDANYTPSASQPWTVNVVSTPPACPVTTFSADPNPVSMYDASQTQITAIAGCLMDIRKGAPNGPLVATGTSPLQAHQAISANTVFYLQPQGDTTAAGTLQTLPVAYHSATGAPCESYGFAATPNPVISGSLPASTTLSAVAGCLFQIRQGSPQGTVLATAATAPSGDYVAMVTAAKNVANGTQFFMVETGFGITPITLDSVTIHFVKDQAACQVGQFAANPQRIFAAGQFGTTTIVAAAGCAFDIRIGGPAGTLFSGGTGYVAAPTGQWVADGMTFYLQKAGDATAAGTLATTTVTLLPAAPTTGPSSRSRARH